MNAALVSDTKVHRSTQTGVEHTAKVWRERSSAIANLWQVPCSLARVSQRQRTDVCDTQEKVPLFFTTHQERRNFSATEDTKMGNCMSWIFRSTQPLQQ